MNKGPLKQWMSYLGTLMAVQGTLFLIVTLIYLLNK